MGIFNASKSQMTEFKLKEKHFPQTRAFIQEQEALGNTVRIGKFDIRYVYVLKQEEVP